MNFAVLYRYREAKGNMLLRFKVKNYRSIRDVG